MKVSFDGGGGFDNVLKWLDEIPNRRPVKPANNIATDGVKSLKKNTPRDTGATANGWHAEVKMEAGGIEIAWKNQAHADLNVNIATLIELGHGTRTGGYVQPQPYIKKSMDSIFKTAGDKLAGELFKL